MKVTAHPTHATHQHPTQTTKPVTHASAEAFAKHLNARRQQQATQRSNRLATGFSGREEGDEALLAVSTGGGDEQSPRQQPDEEAQEEPDLAQQGNGKPEWVAASSLANAHACADALLQKLALPEVNASAFELLMPGGLHITVTMEQVGRGSMVSLRCSDPAQSEQLRGAQSRLSQLLTERLGRQVRVVVCHDVSQALDLA